MTVSNPDGTLDAVHEFDNELQSEGKNILRALLAGDMKIEGHFIDASVMGAQAVCQEAYDGIGTMLEATATTDMSMPDPPLTLSAVCTISKANEGSEIRSVRTFLQVDSQAG